MRVLFWLSRAHAPLWWDSNCSSNDPLLRHPALPLYSVVNLTNTGSAQSIMSGFLVVNPIERNDFGAERLSLRALPMSSNRPVLSSSRPLSGSRWEASTEVQRARRACPRRYTP